MKFDPIEIKDRTGRPVTLRSAVPSDAEDLIRYLKITAAETPYLIREPEEVTLSVEEEVQFIDSGLTAGKALLLVAAADGKHIGNCSLFPLRSYRRYAHRCEIAIALYKEYCGLGIGSQMLRIILDTAKKMGYEQAELEVIANNSHAIALYEKLGFKKYGRLPDNVKYADGSYADALWMMKKLS